MAEQKITTKAFSIKEAIRFGWGTIKKNFWFILPVLIIPYATNWLFSYISSPLLENENAYLKLSGVLIAIAGWIINLELGFATFAVFFKIFDNKKADIKNLFDYFDAGLLFRYFLVSLLYGLIVGVGVLLFIIPGIYFGIKYWFASYVYIDKRLGVLESFKLSARITEGAKWQLFLLGLLQILIILLGVLALFVGLIVAIPLNYLSDIFVYRKLLAKASK